METVVSVTFFLGWTLQVWFGVSVQPKPDFLELPLGITCGVSLLFLLIVSPFFFKSLRVIAVVGWIIALAVLIIAWEYQPGRVTYDA